MWKTGVYGRIHEDVSTRLTPPSRKRTVFRGAHYIFPFDLLLSSHGFPVTAASHTASSWRQWTLLRGDTMRSWAAAIQERKPPQGVSYRDNVVTLIGHYDSLFTPKARLHQNCNWSKSTGFCFRVQNRMHLKCDN